jgi:hypothetical protein
MRLILTAKMRAALKEAHYCGIPTANPRVHPRTLEALEKHGLIHRRRNRKGKELWRPTDAGRMAVVVPWKPYLLHVRSQYGYTRHPGHKAMRNEPEAFWKAA